MDYPTIQVTSMEELDEMEVNIQGENESNLWVKL